jgi:hypothetical protein
MDAIPVVALHDDGFGQQSLIHVGLVHDPSPLSMATACFGQCTFAGQGIDPAPL